MKNNISAQRNPPIVLPQSLSTEAMLPYLFCGRFISGGFYVAGVPYLVQYGKEGHSI